jgi:ferredoxin-NADP reductase
MAKASTVSDRKVVIVSRRMLAEGVVELQMASEDGASLPEWEPGAHIDLVLDSDTIRQYSLCGDPTDRSIYRVAVLDEPDGRGGSRRVHADVAEGDTLMIQGPRNHFTLQESESYVFIAGGIGITPLIPMIRRVAASGLPWHLHYAGRRRSTMAYLPDLELLDTDVQARVHISPSEETGRIDLDLILGSADLGVTVYCCGPTTLLDAVEAAAAARRVRCRTERFAAKRIEGVVDRSFTVRLASSGVELAVARDCPLLDVLFDANADIITSCEEGTCGTCEVTVLEGVPDHRDSVLTADEQAAGDRMMVCVSRSHTPLLVLDL